MTTVLIMAITAHLSICASIITWLQYICKRLGRAIETIDTQEAAAFEKIEIAENTEMYGVLENKESLGKYFVLERLVNYFLKIFLTLVYASEIS